MREGAQHLLAPLLGMLSKLATVPDTDNKHEYLYWYLVVLEDGEHDLLELSLDHEQLQHLHHEPAQLLSI